MLRDQRGSTEPVAFLGLLPLVLLVVLAVAQLSLFGYALVVVEAAARDGARAASVGDSAVDEVRVVARATGVRMIAAATCDSASGMVTVTVRGDPPALLPKAAQYLVIWRTVRIPVEGQCP